MLRLSWICDALGQSLPDDNCSLPSPVTPPYHFFVRYPPPALNPPCFRLEIPLWILRDSDGNQGWDAMGLNGTGIEKILSHADAAPMADGQHYPSTSRRVGLYPVTGTERKRGKDCNNGNWQDMAGFGRENEYFRLLSVSRTGLLGGRCLDARAPQTPILPVSGIIGIAGQTATECSPPVPSRCPPRGTSGDSPRKRSAAAA